MATSEIKAADVIEAIHGSGGMINNIARSLKCTRRNVYYLLEKYSTAREALDDERESMKDHAEGKLLQAVNSGNMTAIIFYLKTQGKDRGYVERHEVDIQVKRVYEALEKAGLDASDVFEELVQRAEQAAKSG